MSFSLTSKDYVEYLRKFHERLKEDKEYITDLDLATGDGDHWTNMNMGMEKIIVQADELEQMPLSDLFKKIGMTMMSVIGGSSGILYGGAYMAAASVLKDAKGLDRDTLAGVWDAMLTDMMKRGKSQPGEKTMLDALAPAVKELHEQIVSDATDQRLLEAVAEAARNGAEATRDMPATKGRASYQANKAVGHLDPGAVTMAYQIEALCAHIRQLLKEGGGTGGRK